MTDSVSEKCRKFMQEIGVVNMAMIVDGGDDAGLLSVGVKGRFKDAEDAMLDMMATITIALVSHNPENGIRLVRATLNMLKEQGNESLVTDFCNDVALFGIELDRKRRGYSH